MATHKDVLVYVNVHSDHTQGLLMYMLYRPTS